MHVTSFNRRLVISAKKVTKTADTTYSKSGNKNSAVELMQTTTTEWTVSRDGIVPKRSSFLIFLMIAVRLSNDRLGWRVKRYGDSLWATLAFMDFNYKIQ